MKITIDELFKHSYVLSCNKARLNLLYKNFERYKLPKPELFPAIVNKELGGKKCTSLSMAAIVKKAKADNWPFVLIFEDDAYPCRDVYNRLSIIDYPDNADIVLLGYHYTSINTKKSLWTQVNSKDMCYGSHAYIVMRSAFDKVIGIYTDDPYKSPDGIWAVEKHMCNTHILDKPLFIQYNRPNTTSNFNHSGYIYFGNNPNPPDGFERVKLNIRCIVTTRCASWGSLNKITKSYVENNVNFVKKCFIPTLENQSVKDFETVILRHPDVPQDWYNGLRGIKSPLNPRITTLAELDDDIKNKWNEYDKIVVARIDTDDFCYNNAAKDILDFSNTDTHDFVVTGYAHGLTMWVDRNAFLKFDPPNWPGSMSVFQGAIYDTSLGFDKFCNPNSWYHTNPNTVYPGGGTRQKFFRKLFDEKDAFIYVRHDGSTAESKQDQFSKTNTFALDPKLLKCRFGLQM